MNSSRFHSPTLPRRFQRLVGDMWRQGRRLRLQQTAASLAFLSLLAAVPVFSLVFSVMTALPVFGRLREDLQRFLSGNLFPEAFSDTVIDYLNLFATRAGGLSQAGAVVFFLTAYAALRTIERTMNAIWAAPRRRAFWRRVALYWMLLTLGPLALGAGLALNGLLLSGWLQGPDLTEVRRAWLILLPWLLTSLSLLLLFRLLPGVRVQWGHALSGALLGASLLALLQRGLGLYVKQLPTYEVVYGAFAAMPLFLIWLFLGWAAVLCGALLASNLRRWHAPDEVPFDESAGRQFEDAWAALRELVAAGSDQGLIALPVWRLRERFDGDAQRAEQTANLLDELGYIVRLVSLGDGGAIAGRPHGPGSKGSLEDEAKGWDAVWRERWVWAEDPRRLSLRRLFDRLWWGAAPDPEAAFPAGFLDESLSRLGAPA